MLLISNALLRVDIIELKKTNIKSICIVTGTRAEYGILHRLIELIEQSDFDLKLVVTGTHLSEKHGSTVNEIINDGHIIDSRIDILFEGDNELEIGLSLAKAVEKFTYYFTKAKPDLVLILGDRYEMLGVASAATICRLPIAHLHGGETTLGALDESIRHSITKMSHLHFVSTSDYERRVIQLGEAPDSVYNVGSLGVDNALNLELLSKKEIESLIGRKFMKRNILVTFHPETLIKKDNSREIEELLTALDTLDETMILLTAPNADIGSNAILESIENYATSNHHKAIFIESLGHLLYLSCLQYIDFVIGNSSSGIIEVPSFNIPTINIGNRQEGRVMSESVINCMNQKEDICAAINRAYDLKMHYNDDFYNPYHKEDTAESIVNILESTSLKNILLKRFHDL